MTIKEIEKLVDESKDLSIDELIKIAYSLGMTECALFCLLFEKKYKKKIPI